MTGSHTSCAMQRSYNRVRHVEKCLCVWRDAGQCKPGHKHAIHMCPITQEQKTPHRGARMDVRNLEAIPQGNTSKNQQMNIQKQQHQRHKPSSIHTSMHILASTHIHPQHPQHLHPLLTCLNDRAGNSCAASSNTPAAPSTTSICVWCASITCCITATRPGSRQLAPISRHASCADCILPTGGAPAWPGTGPLP